MIRIRQVTVPMLMVSLLLFGSASGTEPPLQSSGDYGSQGNLWKRVTPEQRGEIQALGERFKKMIGAARSELMMVRESVRYAEERGFRLWTGASVGSVRSGDRFYAVNRDRTMVLWVVGRQPLQAGMRLINSHIDSVRLELKPHPLREQSGVVTLDTLAHGGIKGYQWVNVPLALTGRIDRKDGTTVWLDLGLNPDDPVLLIPDLAPHVDRDYRDRKRSEAIQREELEPVLISSPPARESEVKGLRQQAEQLLRQKYGIEPDDWTSADIQIVPTLQPRDVGMDRALIAAFGLDDRLTGVINLFALTELKAPSHTAMAYLVTDEEVGSRWNVGVASEWFRKLVAEMVLAETGSVSDLDVMNVFSKTDMVTADTTTATNPLWPGPQAAGNASLMHYGLVIKLYGPGRNANSEYMARLRKMLDEGNVAWQTHSYKAGYGGGTISSYFASMNMEVTDWGVGIWSMHSTYDVASKADLWALWKGFLVFFQS
ncbi:MAG: aminopeptidase 1 [Acidobacteriota bacterium]